MTARRHAARVVRSRGVDGILTPPESGKPWRLGVTTAGTFDNLALEEVPNSGAPLPPGHIRVELHAVAANFRDVMITLGMFTHDALIGSEAAGVVTEVASDVTDFVVGQRVMGLFPEGTGTLVAADARLIAPIPAGWTDAEAAAVLVVFTTAYLGLRELADVQPGQSILIHAATGGVGLAAIQLARHWGMEVFTTASRGKWDTLRALGFDDDHIGDSRTLDFEQKFMTVTGGRGFDVVLDSLAGEFVDASLRLMPRGGMFLEMGKTDIRDADAIAAAYPGVRYRAFDLFEPGRPRMHEFIVELSLHVRRGHPDPAAGHDVGHAPRSGRAALPQPGAPHRQDRHDAARRVGQGHRADHRRHRHGGRLGGPPRRRQPRREATCCWCPAAGRTRRAPPSWSPNSPRRARTSAWSLRTSPTATRCKAVLARGGASRCRPWCTPPACSTTPSSDR